MAVGMLKQLGLIYWFVARPEAGLQVRTGFNWILGVPRSDTLLTLIPVGFNELMLPGILYPLRFRPKFWPDNPVRLGPLSSCVMPESCQPLTKPASILSLAGLPSSMEYAALKMCVRVLA